MTINMKKLKECTSSFDDYLMHELQDPQFQKEYLEANLEMYLEDGDFKAFFKSLERVVKVRESVSSFCKKAKIERTNFYALVRGDRKPQFETVIKILKELGFKFKIA